MRYFLGALCLGISFFMCWCFAESFLVQEKVERRKTPQHMRQEIAEILAEVMELESAYVATKGQIQQELCKHIRSIALNEKNSFFRNASLRELQNSLKLLRHEKERYEKDLVRDQRFLASLRANLQS